MSPSAACQIEDIVAGDYVQLLFALRYQSLGAIEGIFSSLVYFAFKRMENEWTLLVNDIRKGTLRDGLDIPLGIRTELMNKLTPDPTRADDLEHEFSKGKCPNPLKGLIA